MVLREMPKPAWLSCDAPYGDVVLSTRARVMRNLRGRRFPGRASLEEMNRTMRDVLEAAVAAGLDMEVNKSLTNAERDYLVGCRLVSPEFEWTLPGRALLTSRDRSISLMVNEEDHLRVQALTAGWSIDHADSLARTVVDALQSKLPFAHSPELGYIAASPYNLGDGRRQSAMFHLIGLAKARRLPAVLKALGAWRIAVRGLFGESSRAVGAFAQVSVLGGTREEFIGACEYLMAEERTARRELGADVLREHVDRAVEFVRSNRSMSLGDAVRSLAWIRWAASAGVDGFEFGSRAVDSVLTLLEIRTTLREAHAAAQRADLLRRELFDA